MKPGRSVLGHLEFFAKSSLLLLQATLPDMRCGLGRAHRQRPVRPRHPGASAVGDLHPDNAASGPDHYQDRPSPAAPEPPPQPPAHRLPAAPPRRRGGHRRYTPDPAAHAKPETARLQPDCRCHLPGGGATGMTGISTRFRLVISTAFIVSRWPAVATTSRWQRGAQGRPRPRVWGRPRALAWRCRGVAGWPGREGAPALRPATQPVCVAE
jgi:hypothetical protein